MSATLVDELLLEAGGGDAAAVAFLQTFTGIAHVWDDLIDRDRTPTDDEIHGAFQSALLTLPANAFYAKWRHLLDPVMLMAVVNWRAATARERTDPGAWTFVCRSAYVDVAVLVRVITGGLESAVEFAGRVRDKTHAEGLDGYLALLGADGRR